MSSPLVTMIVPTFGRACRQPQVLNECVYWCCNQTYPNVEVLILNDAPGQELTIDRQQWPQVRIINHPKRFANLGDKMNFGTLMASGKICMPAEDDDISLSNRCKQAVEMLGEEFEWWSPMRWFYHERNGLIQLDGNGSGYSSSAYRRESMLGRHVSTIAGHDAAAIGWAKQNLKCNLKEITDPKDVTYIYRWGVSFCHLSGNPDQETAWRYVSPGLDGVYAIVPERPIDWETEVRESFR